MKIHEFQAKSILRGYGVPIPQGQAATTPAEAAGRSSSRRRSMPVDGARVAG